MRRGAIAANAANSAAISMPTWQFEVVAETPAGLCATGGAASCSRRPRLSDPAAARGLALVRVPLRRCVIRCAAPRAGAVSAPDLTHLHEPAHAGGGHAAQQSRQSARLDRGSAGSKPGSLDAQSVSLRRSSSPTCWPIWRPCNESAGLPHAARRHRQRASTRRNCWRHWETAPGIEGLLQHGRSQDRSAFATSSPPSSFLRSAASKR